GKQSDIKAIYEALNAGISVISTIHGKNLQDVLQKNDIKDIISSNTFDRYIILSNKLGAGTVEEILDKDFHTIFKGPKKGGNFT
ncbi:MAG: stage III sporulation protein AA, partial [Thermoanaerobacteraceae bacterium]